MTRAVPFCLTVAAATLFAALDAKAQLPVAPQPREVRPDGTRDPAPQPEAPAKAEDPAVVVDRIIKNSKDVGDKLSKTDTGNDTRKTQDKILADIDSLINRQDPPPPKDDKDNKDNNDQKPKDPMNNKDPMPKDPMNKDQMPNDPMMNPGMPMNQMGNPETPMGNMNNPAPMGTGRRPRTGDPMAGDNKKEPGKADPMQDPMEKKGQPKDRKENKNNPSGGTAGNTGAKATGKPGLPFDEDVAKDVWGHLPDKLRQQMTQFYKEDVMPKYSELLRLYYSSLSEKTTGPTFPKK
jgi:hypothetical protein